jgi:hypothetical protein
LDAIRTCSEYLLSLSRGLRLFSRDPDAGSAAAPSASADLSAWAGDVTPFLRNVLSAGVTLEVDIPPGLPPVAVSPERLTQAAFNLVTNAKDALASGRPGPSRCGHAGACVCLSARREPGGAVRVSVSDNGPGMTEEVKRRCLEPFYTTKTRGISTGLGLSMVHAIAQSCGGSVEIDSEPGRGTTISLVLPPAPVDLVTPPRGRAAVGISDPRTASMVRTLLRSAGFEVADNGAEPGDAAVWVVDASAAHATAAAAFLRAGPSRRVVVYGAESEEPAWSELPVVTLRKGAPLSEIHEAVAGRKPAAALGRSP